MRAFVVGLCLLFGCGGGAVGAARSERAPGEPREACLPIVEMQLLVREHGDDWEPVASIDAQGFVRQHVSRRAGPFARIAADEVRTAEGKPSMRCDAARVLAFADRTGATMRFDPRDGDALVGDGSRIFVSDGGDVEVTLEKGARQPMPWRVSGGLPRARRTAELLVLLAMASADWSFR